MNVKVAIMGAGISGLSCAVTLEKHSIRPCIFEKRSCVGDRFVNAESMFHLLNSPVQDCLPYLRDEFGILLHPTSEVHQIVIHSKNETGCISGRLGYLNIRGRQKDSYEVQLKEQVESPIEYHSKRGYEELCKDFDIVVLATGDSDYASHLGNYRNDLSVSVRGATIEGTFQKDMPHVWFNYEVMPKGYGWVIPYSEKEANLVMLYPDYPGILKMDIDEMWERFYSITRKDLDQDFRITDRFEVIRYMVGICGQPKIENTYFVGNCFGAISPGLGFGQFTSILTGVYSAYDICGLGDYAEFVKPLFANYEHSLVMRRFLEQLEDKDFDLIIKNLNVKPIKQLANKLCGDANKIDILKDATWLMAMVNRLKDFKETH